MKFKKQDFYIGIVLKAIADHPAFTCINKVTECNGVYQLNNNTRILIKYSTNESSSIIFNFYKNEIDELLAHNYFIVLVRKDLCICLLSQFDVEILLDTKNSQLHSINITYQEDGMYARGPIGYIDEKIAYDSFPKKIFEGSFTKLEEKFFWPPLSRINLYETPPTPLLYSTSRRLDLAENLSGLISEGESTVYFGLSTISHEWPYWTSDKLKKIEDRIKYDFEFDGFNVIINQIGINPNLPSFEPDPPPCQNEFLWQLTISEKIEITDEDEDEAS